MIRLGIIGTESSHVNGILRYVLGNPNVKVTAILGDEPNATKRVLETYSLDCEVKSVEEMIGKVDGVMNIMRDGKEHLDMMRPLFGHNIALWIDKPFTASVEDATELISLIEKHNTPFSGGSFIKLTDGVQAIKAEYNRVKGEFMSGYMSFCTKLESEYSGMHFYSHHLIESVLEVYGTGIRSVDTKLKGESLLVTAEYDSFYVIMNYGVSGVLPFYGGVSGVSGSFMTEIRYGDAEDRQVDEFLDVITSGKSPYPTDFFLTAVKVSNAIVKSLDTGMEVKI